MKATSCAAAIALVSSASAFVAPVARSGAYNKKLFSIHAHASCNALLGSDRLAALHFPCCIAQQLQLQLQQRHARSCFLCFLRAFLVKRLVAYCLVALLLLADAQAPYPHLLAQP
jgi:hypothetical protein